MPTVQTNDVETYYERHGEGPTIVCIHGAGLDHRMWDPQAEALSEDYEVLTYDVRGHGQTPIGNLSTYSVDLFVEDLHELVTGLELDAPIVCGLSMGGMIAHQYAARYPEDLDALILAGTRTADPLLLFERVMGTVVFGGALRVGKLFGAERAETILEGFSSVMEWFSDDEMSDEDELEAMSEEATDMDEFLHVMDALRHGYTAVDLSAIAVPTLVLYGGNETAVVETHAGKLGGEIPDATVEKLPDTAHVSNWDSPELFTETVREFLDSRADRGS